jgi:hypothetical protein
MASQKVHLLRYAQSSSLRRSLGLRLIPQLSQALHMELFAVPSLSGYFRVNKFLGSLTISVKKVPV